MVTHHFIGDREAPSALSKIRSRRHVHGTGEIPESLRSMMQKRSFYIGGDSRDQPSVQISQVEESGKRVWRIDVPVGEHRGHRLGQTKERHPARKFLDEVRENVSFESFRPGWQDQSPVPKIRLHDVPKVFRRINGRKVKPLWVYDNARFAFEDSSWPWGLVGRIFNSQ